MLIPNIRANFNIHFMELETLALSLIIIHATLGSIALLAGFLSIVVKKVKNYTKKLALSFIIQC